MSHIWHSSFVPELLLQTGSGNHERPRWASGRRKYRDRHYLPIPLREIGFGHFLSADGSLRLNRPNRGVAMTLRLTTAVVAFLSTAPISTHLSTAPELMHTSHGTVREGLRG